MYLFASLLQGFCFSFVNFLGFAKFCGLSNVVTCARLVILQLSQHFQAIDALISSCFFFVPRVFFGLLIYLLLQGYVVEIQLVQALLQYSQIQHVYVFLKQEQITL